MEKINGVLFKQMLESGMNNLSNHSAEIDALNVFPVPDGDTGTNMHLTVSNGVKEALKTNSDSVKDIAKTLSRGLLMGARGNSGVITSQIFRGIYQAVEDLDDMDASQLAHALVNGSRVAYRAVMRPVEGTILTVVREAADYTYAYTTTEEVTDCMDVMKKMVDEANASLQRTPELLPVLAEVGVVDSGGKGLCVILEGFLAAMEGQPVQLEGTKAAGESAQTKVEGGEEEYGFCTEFILKLSENGIRHFSETSFKDELATIGNSIVCVQDEDLVKVHVHTLEPFTAIKMGRRQGRFIKLKVENMQEQHDNIIEKEEEEKMAEHKKYAIITVAPGDGIKKMFTELRADIVVGGGQTMNPSTEDFVSAVEKLNADHIFILPNNSNIVLAASQAAQVRMYGVFLFGYLSEQNDILTFMRDEVSKDDNWRVQEVLAKAFDEFCKNTGYEKALPIIDDWLENDNPNTRRAVTEGLRIWTSRPYFKDNPNEAIRRIVALKEDPSEYVRKSVGNALRDISKKFPELIKDELNNWKLESKEINQVYKLASKLIN